jgi:hypothetical protein
VYTKKILNGLYYQTVTYDKKLTFCPNGSAGVMFDNNGVHLISYTTRVCTIDNDGFLTCTGTYSRTTIKHISAFIKEYAPNLDYYTAKKCYENKIAINIFTGEIINI